MPEPKRTLLVLSSLLAGIAVAVAGSGDRRAPEAFTYSFFSDEAASSSFLGVRLEEETDHPEGGARVTSLVKDSPAEEAGLMEGDIIVGFDGTVIRGPVALTKRIRETEPGSRVEVSVIRDGKKRKLEVELADRSDRLQVFTVPRWQGEGRLEGLAPEVFEQGQNFQWNVVPGYDLFSGRPTLGVQLVEMTEELRAHLGATEDAGVLVSKVLRDTPAERSDIQVGDLIVAIDGRPIAEVSDIRRALHDREGESISVDLIRDRRERTLEVRIPKRDLEDRPTGPRAMWVVPDTPVAPRMPVAVTPSPIPRPNASPAPLAPPSFVRPIPPLAPVAPVSPWAGSGRGAVLL